MTRWAIAAIVGAVLAATAGALAFTAGASKREAPIRIAMADAAEANIAKPTSKARGPAKPHAQPDVAFPVAEPGKPIMQFGMYFTTYAWVEEPFLNHARMNSPGWGAIPSGSLPELKFHELRELGLIDPDTLYPTAIPKGYSGLGGPVFRFGARYWPELYKGVWVAEWDGDAELTFGWTNPALVKRVNRNRIEYFAPDRNRDWLRVEARKIGPGGFSNLRVYRKENESRVKAGELLEPRFRDFARRYHVIRTMDAQHTNSHWARSIDHMMTEESAGWGSVQPVKDGGHLGGAPWSVLFKIAEETDTALWLHVTGLIGAPEAFDDPELQKSGDKIRQLARTHARAIAESPEWERAAAKLADDLIASSYPSDRRLYVEQNNEIWNFGHPFWRHTHYYMGIGEGVSDGKRGGYGRHGYGYLTARFAHAFEAALAERGRRQAWVPVIASQMAWDGMTRDALEGYRAYFVERGIDPAPWLAIAGVSTASYYGGVFGREGVVRSPNDEAHAGALKAALTADPEGFARRATDWVISGPVNSVGTIPWVIRQRNIHQRVAREYGATFIGDYEGHDHADNWGALSRDQQWENFVAEWRHGDENYRLTKAWIDSLYAQNPHAIISNFIGVGPRVGENGVSSTAPWNDGGYHEDDTGRRRAFGEYLRP